MLYAILLGIFLLMNTIIQVSRLFRQKKKKDGWIYLGLMFIASYLSIGLILDWYIPNPSNGIRVVFQPIQTWINQLLQ